MAYKLALIAAAIFGIAHYANEKYPVREKDVKVPAKERYKVYREQKKLWDPDLESE